MHSDHACNSILCSGLSLRAKSSGQVQTGLHFVLWTESQMLTENAHHLSSTKGNEEDIVAILSNGYRTASMSKESVRDPDVMISAAGGKGREHSTAEGESQRRR
jgi:hypothetical protein